jgi:hypothetical protein
MINKNLIKKNLMKLINERNIGTKLPKSMTAERIFRQEPKFSITVIHGRVMGNTKKGKYYADIRK